MEALSPNLTTTLHASKLGELYSDLAKEAFRPYESFVAKVTPVK